jgi:tetratricopeptide (TPR) repeat protein
MAASIAVLFLSVYLLWNARSWDYLPFVNRPANNLDARSQLLNDKIEIYNHEADDLSRMVAVLLVLSAAYVIAFAVSSHFAAERYQRYCEQSLDTVHQDCAKLMGDLREVREQAERAVERAAMDCGRVEELIRRSDRPSQPPPSPPVAPQPDIAPSITRLRESMAEALDQRKPGSPFAIADYERALAALAALAEPKHAGLLAPIYRDLALYYDNLDAGQAGYYRGRANALAPGIAPEPRRTAVPGQDAAAAAAAGAATAANAEMNVLAARRRGSQPPPGPVTAARTKYNSALLARAEDRLDDAEDLLRNSLASARADAQFASEIQYELGCTLALRGPGCYEQAVECLRLAFRHKTPSIEKRISRDIDEGGALYALASQPPFDRAINDLLLDVNVP